MAKDELVMKRTARRAMGAKGVKEETKGAEEEQ